MRTLKLVRYITECKDDTMGLFRRIHASPLSSIEPYRTEILEALQHAVPRELVPFFLPSKVKSKAGTIPVLSHLLLEGYPVSEILQRARAGKTANHFLVTVTEIRKELENMPGMEEIRSELLAHPTYRETYVQAKKEQIEGLRNREEKEYDSTIFSLHNAVAQIGKVLEKIETRGLFSPTMDDIIFLYICFAARPGELHLLNIDSEGNIGGQLKTRGKDVRYPYDGLVPIEEAKVLLNYVKSSVAFFPTTPKKRILFNAQLREKYGISLRDLREIGANLIVSSSRSKIDQILRRSNMLRHSDLKTSLFYHNTQLTEGR